MRIAFLVSGLFTKTLKRFVNHLATNGLVAAPKRYLHAPSRLFQQEPATSAVTGATSRHETIACVQHGCLTQHLASKRVGKRPMIDAVLIMAMIAERAPMPAPTSTSAPTPAPTPARGSHAP
jgi:hypothetical protein